MPEMKFSILDGMPDMLDEHQVAKVLNVAEQTLRKWRCNGSGGPSFVKYNGSMVRYPKEGVRAFMLDGGNGAAEGV